VKVIAIIPSRYNSTRFPGKPLADIAGKPMVQRVYESVASSSIIDAVVVATDDQRIFDAVTAFGGQVVMTSEDHLNGTSRCVEALGKIDGDFDLMINVQGDEPGIMVSHIEAVVSCFDNDKADIGTLVYATTSAEDITNSNRVKVACSKSMRALYFSRSPIPFQRNQTDIKHFMHIGLYAFKTEILETLIALEPSSLELSESLEQLRWLENDYLIHTQTVASAAVGVDTPEDLERIITSHDWD